MADWTAPLMAELALVKAQRDALAETVYELMQASISTRALPDPQHRDQVIRNAVQGIIDNAKP
jgi:hypothetical protein